VAGQLVKKSRRPQPGRDFLQFRVFRRTKEGIHIDDVIGLVGSGKEVEGVLCEDRRPWAWCRAEKSLGDLNHDRINLNRIHLSVRQGMVGKPHHPSTTESNDEDSFVFLTQQQGAEKSTRVGQSQLVGRVDVDRGLGSLASIRVDEDESPNLLGILADSDLRVRGIRLEENAVRLGSCQDKNPEQECPTQKKKASQQDDGAAQPS